MAEFIEVMKQKERMCKAISCSVCNLKRKASEEKYSYCVYYQQDYPQEAEEIIMEWAEKHPIQTNADKFKEVFGFIPHKACIKFHIEECYDKACCTCEDKNFWDKEYKTPKVKEGRKVI